MRERNQKKPKKIEREKEEKKKKIKRKPNPIGEKEKGRKITKILQGVGIRKIRDPFDFLFISR